MVLGGCSSERLDTTRFTPASDAARTALETVLLARKARGASAQSSAPIPGIITVDSHDRPEAELISFRVVGERPTDVGRTFVVELEWSNASERERATFVVLGIDPLLVFREEDLAMITHWEDAMAHPDSSNK